ncbi:chorismate mutase [Alicyclobacillus kakegawensis]|uniref:chorismate mutase n=1 Tax=Alicyclobacillus kakegawensis TaxID=392012 RepID=UPI00082C62A7|nr:chorismate mutase [Alicyclobacillus kakegawensis]
MATTVRGIRGAITVAEDSAEAILTATHELMAEITKRNALVPEDVVSVLLTMTPDLTACFPARAVRSLPGWQWVPLMCASEVAVAGGLERCIRVLVHVNTERTQAEMEHVYLGAAVQLRPDLAQ